MKAIHPVAFHLPVGEFSILLRENELND